MLNPISNLLIGALFNLLVAFTIVRFIYYPPTQNRNYVFTFLGFNTVIYFVLGLLSQVDLSMGVGFGLFAIFSVLRYRTDEIPIREMTYLFIIIALPVMNSVLMSDSNWPYLLVANGFVVVLLFVLEKGWGFHFETNKRILYEQIELITPEKRPLLLQDLQQRLGLPIKRVEIETVDFLRDTANLRIFYDEQAAPLPRLLAEESAAPQKV